MFIGDTYLGDCPGDVVNKKSDYFFFLPSFQVLAWSLVIRVELLGRIVHFHRIPLINAATTEAKHHIKQLTSHYHYQ